MSVNIEAILSEVTIGHRREKLYEMARGNGLSDAYTATLTRLKAQKGNRAILGQQALMWVLYSERPLRAEELCHALGVRMGSTDRDLDNVPAIRTLLASCLGLLTVEASSSIVRLVHFTLKEHLASDPILLHSSHSTIAEVCLTYLNFGSVRALSPTPCSVPPTMPLLEYASLYWGDHARRGMTENVRRLALRLLERFNEHVSSQLLLYPYARELFWDSGSPKDEGLTGFTGLHGVAYFGLVELIASVLEMKEWDLSAADSIGRTALVWAARMGQEAVVNILLERKDLNPDQPDTGYGRTPLSWAAGSGHEGIVEILLKRKDVNPDQPDAKYGRTPLSWAAESGHEGIVKTLLERNGVRPSMPDNDNQTPLLLALSEGHHSVVRLLWEWHNANSDKTNGGGQASLSPSARPADEFVVETQFGSHDPNTDITHFNRDDVNSDQANHSGQETVRPSRRHENEFVAEVQPGSHDLNIETTDPLGQPELLPAALHDRVRLSDAKGSISRSIDHGPSIQWPRGSRLLSIWPLNLLHRRRKNKTYPNTP